MSMEGYLGERAQRALRNKHQDSRDISVRSWLRTDEPPEVRLLSFDRWLRAELALRLEWTWAGASKEKRLEQCRLQINGMVLDLWRRGWMLDGHRLGLRINDMLDRIGNMQRAGHILDFWSYFKATVDRYVGLNAEEIQAEAMSLGVTSGQVFQALAKRVPGSCTIPELIAQRSQETLRDKLSRQRRAEGRKAAQKDQLPLL
jgi:hypothetical protein